MTSFHGELASGSGKDLIGDDDLLGSSPEVLMAPGPPPFHEVEHWEHGDGESPDKGLSPHHWEEGVGEGRGQQTILEASVLVVGYPVLALAQVILRDRRDVRVVDQV